MIIPFFMAMDVFKQPVEELLRLWKPDCIVAGLAFHWATESAKSLGIPRLYFTGSQEKCFGTVVNSFHELEPGYSQHYREVMGRKAWFIGPLSLCNDTTLDKAIAAALEASMQSFIWVVKKGDKEKEEWLPEGFEKRMEGKSEQFINEKLVTDVLRIGVGVGSEEWSRNERKIIVGREDIERAINQVMAVGEEAEEMRKRAMEMKEKAVKANEEGGSSYSDLKSLFEELASVRDNKD
ncbi:UDP-glucose flavonoid 3-O-glucosyltransferase 7 [Linum perenne]